MQGRYVALIGVGTFALGLGLGQTWHLHAADMAAGDGRGTVAAVLPPDHPVVGGDDLQQAVRATLRAGAAAGSITGSIAKASGGSAALAAQAEEQRRQRRFQAAADTYRRMVAAGSMTADTWADFADALASAKSSLRGEPAQAVERALEIDPRHPKALWLKASLEHEQHRYTAAMKTWEALLAVVPEDSSDARIIRANIAEASRLASARS